MFVLSFLNIFFGDAPTGQYTMNTMIWP